VSLSVYVIVRLTCAVPCCAALSCAVLCRAVPCRAVLCCAAGNLLVTGSFSSLLSHLGIGGTYLLYALLNGAAVGFVVGLVVETKCRWAVLSERSHNNNFLCLTEGFLGSAVLPLLCE